MEKIIFTTTCSCLLFVFLMNSCKSSVTPFVTTDEDLYKELQVPLVGTIMYNSTTLHSDEDEGQLFSYAFEGHITNLPYRITLSRKVAFEDCDGCIGDWEVGMFSKPEYRDGFVSLKDFVIQMIYANNNVSPNDGGPVKIWVTSGFIWKIRPLSEGGDYLIEVVSLYDERWSVRI